MNEKHTEILLVEDDANDEMLAMHAFKKHNLADKTQVVRDGAEALEFVFCTGAFAGRHFENPRVILLDKKLPLVDGMEVLRQIREDPRHSLDSNCHAHFLGGRAGHHGKLSARREQLHSQAG